MTRRLFLASLAALAAALCFAPGSASAKSAVKANTSAAPCCAAGASCCTPGAACCE